MTPKEIALECVRALDAKKGRDIKLLETGELTTLADYFVICSATSATRILMIPRTGWSVRKLPSGTV